MALWLATVRYIKWGYDTSISLTNQISIHICTSIQVYNNSARHAHTHTVLRLRSISAVSHPRYRVSTEVMVLYFLSTGEFSVPIY